MTTQTPSGTDKKSFLLYKDSADIINAMTPDQAGHLFKAIYKYQTDGYEVDVGPELQLVLKMFISTFKRDDEKYKTTCANRSKAGVKGAKQKLAKAGKRKHKVATQADSDIDSVIESDSERDSTGSRSAPAQVADAPSAFNFVIKDGSAYALSEKNLVKLKETFRNVDVEQELRKAALWLDAAPSRRKTERGMMKFLGGWIGRATPSTPEQSKAELMKATGGGFIN